MFFFFVFCVYVLCHIHTKYFRTKKTQKKEKRRARGTGVVCCFRGTEALCSLCLSSTWRPLNFAKGAVFARVFVTRVLQKLQLTAFQRARLPGKLPRGVSSTFFASFVAVRRFQLRSRFCATQSVVFCFVSFCASQSVVLGVCRGRLPSFRVLRFEVSFFFVLYFLYFLFLVWFGFVELRVCRWLKSVSFCLLRRFVSFVIVRLYENDDPRV